MSFFHLQSAPILDMTSSEIDYLTQIKSIEVRRRCEQACEIAFSDILPRKSRKKTNLFLSISVAINGETGWNQHGMCYFDSYLV